MAEWHLDPITAFDLETGGVSTKADRIVTGYVATILGRADGRTVLPGAQVLIDPGVDIDPKATEVHGITTEHARKHGCDPADGVNSIAEALARSLLAHIPVIGFNVSFDLSMLYWECLRHGVPTVAERLGLAPGAMVGPIIDAHVLDKHVDPYRRGSRKLDVTAAHYGIRLDNAHTADADAMAAARVAVAIAEEYPEIAQAPPRSLHQAQKLWRAEQMTGLQHYFRTKGGKPDAWCDPCWPICTDPTHPSG
jgi:DNA polymerase III subunit epsilon